MNAKYFYVEIYEYLLTELFGAGILNSDLR